MTGGGQMITFEVDGRQGGGLPLSERAAPHQDLQQPRRRQEPHHAPGDHDAPPPQARGARRARHHATACCVFRSASRPSRTSPPISTGARRSSAVNAPLRIGIDPALGKPSMRSRCAGRAQWTPSRHVRSSDPRHPHPRHPAVPGGAVVARRRAISSGPTPSRSPTRARRRCSCSSRIWRITDAQRPHRGGARPRRRRRDAGDPARQPRSATRRAARCARRRASWSAATR